MPDTVGAAPEALPIRIDNASKTFGLTRVLSDFSIEVIPGEVHALIGENGCGKSTLIKGLSGFHAFDSGATLTLEGQAYDLPLQVAELKQLGVRFIHQDLGLVPTLNVIENVAMDRGFETRRGAISWSREARRAAEMLELFGDLGISPWALVSSLSQAQRTIVAIARALGGREEKVRLLVLDEPTAALPESEVEVLFTVMRRLQDLGVGMIFVSHRLEEIFEIADRVTVMRDGVVVGTRDIGSLDEHSLTEMIVGKPVEEGATKSSGLRDGPPLLEAHGITGRRVSNLTLSIRAGEILGIAGLAGSGRSELARILAGAQTPVAGSIRLADEMMRFRAPRDAIRAGVAYVPENRAADGSIGTMTVAENLTLPMIDRFRSKFRLDKKAERSFAARDLETYDVRPRDTDRVFSTLSGGNQQKVILAKWMGTKPRLLVMDEPVQGVDIGAREDIYAAMLRAAEQGLAVLMINSDFEDLARVSDRVLVMRRGQIVAELTGDELSRHRISSVTYASGGAA